MTHIRVALPMLISTVHIMNPKTHHVDRNLLATLPFVGFHDHLWAGAGPVNPKSFTRGADGAQVRAKPRCLARSQSIGPGGIAGTNSAKLQELNPTQRVQVSKDALRPLLNPKKPSSEGTWTLWAWRVWILSDRVRHFSSASRFLEPCKPSEMRSRKAVGRSGLA